jgi:hypothetical protein
LGTRHTFSLVAAYHQGVVERGAPGDSDYTGEYVDEPTPGDGDADYNYVLEDVPQGHPVGIAWSETEWGHPERQPEPVPRAATEGRFDAFDATTWNFKPAPPPWYDSTQAKLAIAAVSAAAVAMVVSIVLLLLPGSSGDDEPSTSTSTSPTTTATTATSSALPPPPPPPPPPTSEAPSQAPVIGRPRQPTRQSNKPEIGVTRTPVTRSPLSVSPQRPGTNR